jgi:hypothetical protein
LRHTKIGHYALVADTVPIPIELRPALSQELDRLVRGELPDLLRWVHHYGPNGAVLVPQPDAVWDHPWAGASQTVDGGWHVVVPLFTEAESPSDLSAELRITPDGVVAIENVHVL